MEALAVTAVAPVNIAVIKYWGKRNVELNLPTNSSISVTLSTDDLRAITSVAVSPQFSEDLFWLNGELQNLIGSKHINCVNILRKERALLEAADPGLKKLSNWKIRIISENNFPTAAGLASSAAGYAALVFSISKLFELDLNQTELSKVARVGSGSSSRSLFGGYVAWQAGNLENGDDSVAVEVAPVSHWPNMRALVLVISAGKKSVSSTGGMQRTVGTSTLFPARHLKIVPERMSQMEDAIRAKDFGSFAKLTMCDSNQFHAVCLDSYPPILYLNDTSRAVISFVHYFNEYYGAVKLAYTFDAGPNAVLYFLEEDSAQVLSCLKPVLPAAKIPFEVDEGPSGFCFDAMDMLKIGITDIVYSRVGPGPEVVETSLFAPGDKFVPITATQR
ncbi:Diphosphomevalonate decarboxylase [Ascobolus immersus RN42]|uniref:Diphosphomevalonate decarboxylase n=1 Tax=Ascobolus immersus RN42 TaxID=1160509 RepID=A0A3N4I6U3_ASCIM|nr:Diphosphomevalonate decarboxylase [Ascobolus immersus RN42]